MHALDGAGGGIETCLDLGHGRAPQTVSQGFLNGRRLAEAAEVSKSGQSQAAGEIVDQRPAGAVRLDRKPAPGRFRHDKISVRRQSPPEVGHELCSFMWKQMFEYGVELDYVI